MTAYVIDASVALKWYVPEQDSPIALELLSEPGAALHAPGLLRIEIANAMWRLARTGQISHEIWPQAHSELVLSIDHWHSSSALLGEAMMLARDLNHPVYDCIYVALAKRIDAKLVTADQRLAGKLAAASFARLAAPLDTWRQG